jgi:hypothetical protein
LRKEAIPVDESGNAHVVEDRAAALAELARRTAMLDAISYGAAQIIGAEDWRAGIQEMLNRLGRATEVSRVTLFEIHQGADGQPVETCRYDWAEPGLPRLSGDPRYRDMPLVEHEGGQLGDWLAARRRGEIVQATLKDVTGETRRTFLEHGTQSFISVPIMLRSGVWGFLGLDDCRSERVWHTLEIDVLRTAAALVAGLDSSCSSLRAMVGWREGCPWCTWWMACTNSSGPESFSRYPSAPALIAGKTFSSAAKLVRTRGRAPGRRAVIRRIASIPST